MSSSSDNLPLNELEKELLDPTSECYLENLLDVVSALVTDCDFPSAKNSKSVQSFLKKYSQAAKIIESRRTKYSDFELIKVIGQGGFGRVELARHKRTRLVYAIKLMSKQHLLDHSQSGYWEERDVMVKASSEWLVACHYAFLDKDNVYLCMEYMPGGDLYYWLEKYDTFDETIARFYLAETVLALEALHQLGFIHRDLKPDNMLLDAGGHLKLADFGSCVRVGNDGYYYCTSPIGTPDYISPEMLSCQGKPGKIGPACDWWALGVIAYEMFFGEPAFYGQSLVETYSRILGHEKSLHIPIDADPISSEAEQFIKDLLKSSTTRLGSFDLLTDNEIIASKNNRAIAVARQVKSHSFFKTIEWEQLRSENPPIQPIVNSETDTSNINFDDRDLSSENGGGGGGAKLPHSGGAFAPARSQAPAYFTGSNLSFAGFTFNRYHRYLEMFSQPTSNNNNNTTTTTSNCNDVLQRVNDTCRTENNDILLNEALERQRIAEETLNNLKKAFQTLECQSAKDQVNLKDLNRRLIESQEEVEQLKIIQHDIEYQLNNLQLEKDNQQLNIEKIKTQCESLTLTLETEYTNNNLLKNEKNYLEERVKQLENELKYKNEEISQKSQLPNNEKEEVAATAKSSDTSETLIAATSPSTIINMNTQDNNNDKMIITINQLTESITILKNENKNLLNENEQVKEKCTTLMTTVIELRENLERQINELTKQLEISQQLNDKQLNENKYINDILEQNKLINNNLRNDLNRIQSQYDACLDNKRIIEDQLLNKETELASLQVRLRNITTNYNELHMNTENEAKQLNNLLNRKLIEINKLSEQLNEMRNHCKTIEITNNHLTQRVEQLQKDKEIQQRNLDTLVEKFYTEMKSRTNQLQINKTKLINRDEYKQLEKKYKNLQSITQKDINNLHNTIEQYKIELNERNQLITTLTEECQTMYKELGQQRQLERTLRGRLDYYIHSHTSVEDNPSIIITDSQDNHHHQHNESSEETMPATTTTLSPDVIGGGGGGGTGITSNLLNIILEDVVDIDSKGRGKNKLIWLPKYAVLKRFSLLLYTSRSERELNPSLGEEIPLYQIMHIREATELDLIHAKKDDLCRTIQLFYQNSTKIHHLYEMNTNDEGDIDLSDSISLMSISQQQTLRLPNKSTQEYTTTTSTTTNPGVNSSIGSSSSSSNTIQWMNHSFQLMRFHLGNVLCDVCHKNCSDLLNPPKALECLHCRMRIHFEHVDKHEKFIVCHNATNVRYLRMSNTIVKKIWIEEIIKLRQYYKELQNNIPEQLNDIDVNATTHNNNNSSIVHMKPIYRSLRAGSLGPIGIQSITLNQKADSINYLQYSFRKKIISGTNTPTCNTMTTHGIHVTSSLSPGSISPALTFPKLEDN
ncbi:unnamed protein product [Heterobilharzia americana]|nr:unnamed protein product [Heterobilharzia americana]